MVDILMVDMEDMEAVDGRYGSSSNTDCTV